MRKLVQERKNGSGGAAPPCSGPVLKFRNHTGPIRSYDKFDDISRPMNDRFLLINVFVVALSILMAIIRRDIGIHGALCCESYGRSVSIIEPDLRLNSIVRRQGGLMDPNSLSPLLAPRIVHHFQFQRTSSRYTLAVEESVKRVVRNSLFGSTIGMRYGD